MTSAAQIARFETLEALTQHVDDHTVLILMARSRLQRLREVRARFRDRVDLEDGAGRLAWRYGRIALARHEGQLLQQLATYEFYREDLLVRLEGVE